MAMPCTSSWIAAVTTSSTERLWPRWMTSAPVDWMMRRMMLMAASCPSNRLVAVTKRTLFCALYVFGLANSTGVTLSGTASSYRIQSQRARSERVLGHFHDRRGAGGGGDFQRRGARQYMLAIE